jgi:NADH:ubiquinone oxidoreductase subunit 6 (subunit J)
MVLYLFVNAYVGGVEESIWEPIPGQRFLAPVFAAAIFIEISIAVIGTGLTAIESEGPTLPGDFGSPAQIGELMLERFLVVFEAASMLLLIAAVGAVVLAGRRRREEEPV